MVKFIHTSDWHLGRKNYSSEERFKDNFRAIHNMIEIIKGLESEEIPDFLLHTGDVFHNQNVDSKTFNETIKIFLKIKELEIPVYVIRGNHDADEDKYQNTFLHALEQVGLIKMISTQLDSNKSVFEPISGVRIYGVGHRYSAYRERLEEILNFHPIDTDFINILGIHAGVSGFDDADNRTTFPGGISFSANFLLDLGFKYVALGHFHGKSIYQPKKNGFAVAYSGSTEHWTYANWDPDGINNEKSLLLIEIKNNIVNIQDIRLNVRPKILLRKDYHNLDPQVAISQIMGLLKTKESEFESLVPLSTDFSRRHRYLPIINFQFSIGFNEEEYDYPFDRLKFKLENILHSASFIRIEPIIGGKEIDFEEEEDLCIKIIESLYPENKDRIAKLVERSLTKQKNLLEDLESKEKAQSELEEFLWKTYMEEAV